MQYTISMTTRMLAIAALCAFLLCVLLFLLGIELGKRMAEAPVRVDVPAITMPGVAPPALPALPAAPAITAPATKP